MSPRLATPGRRVPPSGGTRAPGGLGLGRAPDAARRPSAPRPERSGRPGAVGARPPSPGEPPARRPGPRRPAPPRRPGALRRGLRAVRAAVVGLLRVPVAVAGLVLAVTRVLLGALAGAARLPGRLLRGLLRGLRRAGVAVRRATAPVLAPAAAPLRPLLAVRRERADRRAAARAAAGRPRRRLRLPRVGRLGAALLTGAGVLLLGGGGLALATSDRLAVREVTVGGTGFTTVEQVRAAAGVRPGEPLALVDAADVRGAVEAIPEVAEVAVERHWPDRLHLAVTERVPVVAVADDGEAVLVDATGTPFRTEPRPPDAVPLLVVRAPAPGDPATAAGLDVVAALPPGLRAQVERIEVPDPADVSLRLRDGAAVRWGGADRSAAKAAVLAALLPRGAQEYDVRAPEVAVTRG